MSIDSIDVSSSLYIEELESSIPAGYQQTELGIIPSDWGITELLNLCERISVGLATSVTKYYRTKGIPIVRNMNIKDGYFDGSDMLYLDPDFAKANISKAASALDVITVHTGSNIGLTCVLPLSFDKCQTFTTLITTTNKKLLSPFYLCFHMGSQSGRKEIARLQVGGGKGNLNTGELKQYLICYPQNVEEQTAIANALSDVDALIQELEKLIAKKQAIKTATMQQLLTGRTRLPQFAHHPDGRKKGYKPSELGEIPEDWEVVTLGNLGVTYGGLSGKAKGDFGSGNSLYVPFTNVMANVVIDINCLEKVHVTENQNRVIRNDLLFNGSSETPEEVCLCSFVAADVDNLFLNSFCFGFRSKSEDRFFPLFLSYWFRSDFGRAAVSTMAQGSTRYNVSKSQFLKLNVVLPDLLEQKAIVDFLTDMDSEILSLEQRLSKTRQIKQGMMQELLTGKTRLVKPAGVA